MSRKIPVVAESQTATAWGKKEAAEDEVETVAAQAAQAAAEAERVRALWV